MKLLHHLYGTSVCICHRVITLKTALNCGCRANADSLLICWRFIHQETTQWHHFTLSEHVKQDVLKEEVSPAVADEETGSTECCFSLKKNMTQCFDWPVFMIHETCFFCVWPSINYLSKHSHLPISWRTLPGWRLGGHLCWSDEQSEVYIPWSQWWWRWTARRL